MKDEIKIAIINPDGKINNFYIGDEDFFHSYILRSYLNLNYDKLDLVNIDLNNANSMSLFLRESGNIVFLNTTTYKDKKPLKDGKIGVIFMPDELSENQKNSLLDFKNSVSNYDELQIFYNFLDKLSCNTLFTKNKEQVKTIIDYILEKYSHQKGK